MSVTADILTPNWSMDAIDPLLTRSSVDGPGMPTQAAPSRLADDDASYLARPAPAQDWAKLIDLVQNAAQHSRDLEAKAQEQELRVQDLLYRVRADIRRAGEQVRAAEMRAREAQAQAEAVIVAAEERASAAEARARVAEDWLMRVQEAVMTGFAEAATGRDGPQAQ